MLPEICISSQLRFLWCAVTMSKDKIDASLFMNGQGNDNLKRQCTFLFLDWHKQISLHHLNCQPPQIYLEEKRAQTSSKYENCPLGIASKLSKRV